MKNNDKKIKKSYKIPKFIFLGKGEHIIQGHSGQTTEWNDLGAKNGKCAGM